MLDKENPSNEPKETNRILKELEPSREELNEMLKIEPFKY